MPPQSEEVSASSLKIIPPPNRSANQTGEMWLQDKHTTDGAEGLWRIHEKIYDFSNFINSHPGGSEWLELTKGTDITEAFEVHHLTNLPEEMLKTYYVKEANNKRNVPFTFHEDGFYRTLKREIKEMLRTLPKQPVNTSKFFIDSLLAGMFVFACLANCYWNYWLAILAGNFLALVTIAAHNYFHKKDNFRMLYFNFSLMQTREWRISHVLSHHLHTNTIDDMEITMNEPLAYYLPQGKTTFLRYGPWLYFPFYWAISFHLAILKRLYYVARGETKYIMWYDFIPFTLPLAMYLIGNQSLFATFWMWTVIVMVGSFHFFAVGFNAAHHHPDIFHDGDAPRSQTDYDWGLSQLDAVMDRKDITGSHFLVLTNFGDHALHHLFPTLDHGTLEMLYPTFNKILKQFNVDLRITSQLELIKGSFQQIARTAPNPNPPNLLKKY